MLYRKATIDDLDTLVDLRIEFLAEANNKPYTPEAALRQEIACYFSKHIPDDTFVAWLCIENAEVIATSGISLYELPPNYSCSNGKTGYVSNMYTKPGFRKKGIAKALFGKLLEEGKQKGVSKFILHASSDGKGVYKKFGFVMSRDEMHLSVDWNRSSVDAVF